MHVSWKTPVNSIYHMHYKINMYYIISVHTVRNFIYTWISQLVHHQRYRLPIFVSTRAERETSSAVAPPQQIRSAQCKIYRRIARARAVLWFFDMRALRTQQRGIIRSHNGNKARLNEAKRPACARARLRKILSVAGLTRARARSQS